MKKAISIFLSALILICCLVGCQKTVENLPSDYEVTRLATRAVSTALNYRYNPISVALGNDFGYGADVIDVKSDENSPALLFIVEEENSYKYFTEKYGNILTGKAYDDFIGSYFSEVDGKLCAKDALGEHGVYSLNDVSAEFKEKTADGYIYKITYTVTYGVDFDTDTHWHSGTAETKKEVTVKIVETDGKLKISEAENLF